MNAGPTADRVYHALRSLVLNHAFHPGDRLDAAQLAEQLSASITPVRDALNTLTGEGLVETRRAGGYHLPSLDEPGLRDMLAWEAQMLRLALRNGRAIARPSPHSAPHGAYAERVAGAIARVAAASGNREHARALSRLGARLYAVRTLEEAVIPDAGHDLADIEHALNLADVEALRQLWDTWYRRRLRSAASLVRAAYRVSGTG